MEELHNNGDYVVIDGHRMHVYRTGNENGPKLVFMSGSSTVAPAYDFKILYEKLQDDYRIIVIEKFGYGYSDLYVGSADINTLVGYQRKALEQLGEKGPFVLLPHSMAGIEAIRWKQMYPEEVSALIGLDMTSPISYAEWTDADVESKVKTMRALKKLKLYWLSPLPRCASFADSDKQQLKLLRKRNAFNECYFKEAECVKQNASYVGEHGTIDCPALLFCSNGKQTFKNWIQNQKTFAEEINAELICYDCGHYLHYYKSDEMNEQIRRFIAGSLAQG
ncbi:MAG: alpha/beta hydrolase [Clostridiales bacterium]|nr:alpha/beta hydrolase [Clostridiales bacterium]